MKKRILEKVFKYHPSIARFLIYLTRIQDPRPMIKAIKSRVSDKELVGVEIGVWRGSNALSILRNLNIRKLYLIDPYISYHNAVNSKKEYELKQVKQECLNRLAKYKNKVILIEKPSDVAWKEIKEKVDFVYIDGDHSYKQVKKDIKNYLPLIKDTGFIGGHDIDTKLFTDKNPQRVLQAVIDSFPSHKIKIFSSDWWVET
jgi:predicted O-methyltransferase YrrM